MVPSMRARARVLRFAGLLAGVAVVAALQVAQAAGAWGGRYNTSTGETVHVTASDRYPVDETMTRGWAEYLASLVHGPEIAHLTLYLAPGSEVQAVCGLAALGCYSGTRQLIVAPRDDYPGGTTAQAIVAHEYGHHIARNRVNPPWSAVAHGTKRWASRLGVCARADAGTLFPGGSGIRYRLDPGEGFAESYRLLNELRAGRPESPWDIVDTSLRPDAQALAALEQDILNPWTKPVVEGRSGTFRARGNGTRTIRLATPLDGNLQLKLAAPAKMRLRLTLVDTSRNLAVATGGRKLTTLICGQRALAVRVTRLAGAGTFRLSITKP
jgi:hypothetical protein